MATQSPKDFARDLDTLFRAQCARLDLDEPWFGRFVLDTKGDAKAYLIGHGRHPDERIINWQSPLAKAYYESEPGEEFELDAPQFAHLSGIVESRCAITAADRRIRKLELRTRDESHTLVLGDEGFVSPDETPTARAAQEGLGDILGLITKEQYRLITSSRSKPIIIQGRAGSGKTSVALYRVGYLTWPSEDASEAPIDPSRVLIVMFNKALSTFVKGTLEAMKLEGVKLDTFHGWALETIKRGYRGQIDVGVGDYPGKDSAIRLKKQLGILHATEAFVVRQIKAVDAWLEAKLAPYDKQGEFIESFREMKIPVARRIARLRTRALRERDAATTPREQRRLSEIHTVLQKGMTRLTKYKEDLLKLLTDRALLKEHLSTATSAQIDDLVRYQTALQNDGGKSQIAFEDFAILLRLMQLKNGGLPNKDRDDEVNVFDHLVIDEAQDFGAVELTALLHSVKTRAGVTIVGDVNQKIVPEADFVGWDALAEELGVSGAEVAKLEVAHRSTAPIMAIADAIVGDKPSRGRPGARPSMTIVDEGELFPHVAEIVRDAVAENVNGHVCVIVRRAGDVRGAYDALKPHLDDLPVPIRIGYNKSFTFGAGVTVTNMRQVKGLEFDTVVVLDPTDEHYPDTENGRRALYTMVTRAKDALYFASSQSPGALLRSVIDQGLVSLNDETEFEPVSFTEEDDEPF